MFGDDTLVPIALFLSLAFGVVSVTRIISDGRTRRRLIDAGATPELARALAATTRNDPGFFGALKWGLVTLAVGLALIVIQFLPFRSDEPIVAGLILLFLGGGLLAYFAGARRLARRSE